MRVIETFVQGSIPVCKPNQSVIFLKLVEMNVIQNVQVSTHFQDVASLHLSYLSCREWPQVKYGQSCLLLNWLVPEDLKL